MNFLYTISNVCVPFSMMIFQTAKRDTEGLKPSYGKWLVLFLLTFIFGILSFFKIWWITLLDLAFKCSLYFLPANINDMIESHISSMHLEGLIQTGRNRFVNMFFIFYQKALMFLLSKLRPEESEQFKQELNKSISNEKVGAVAGITAVPKIFQSTGINCTLMNEDSVAKTLMRRQIERKRNDIQKRVSSDSRRSESSKKMKPEKESSRVEAQLPTSVKRYENKPIQMKKSQPAGFNREDPKLKHTDSFHKLRQSSKILPDDFDDEEDINSRPSRFSRQTDPETLGMRKSKQKIKGIERQTRENSRRDHEKPIAQTERIKQNIGKKKEEPPRSDTQSSQSELRRRKTDISDVMGSSIKSVSRKRSISPDSKQQIQMLQKLDVSASEYSDMFEDDKDDDFEEEGQEEVKQVCRVESIVQIGSAPSSKLEIYYLELYSNGDLRIMSLYGRQFEKHKLVSMTKAQNSYYNLFLSGGNVTQRRVKFRGQYQPFMKYIQKK